MIAPSRLKILTAAATACVFLLQSCATMTRGTSQNIPVTSNPAGARVIADGKDMGRTPLSLSLSRKKTHLIRVEKEGYVPLEIRAESKVSGGGGASFFGNLLWGMLGAIPGTLVGMKGVATTVVTLDEQGKEDIRSGKDLMLLGFLVGFVGALTIDMATGAQKTIQPKELNVTLEKAAEGTRSGVAVLSIKDWQSIKWIRIACPDSDDPAGTILLK
jgi:hypothetical protein